MTTRDTTQNRETALTLAAKGLYVFPCESGGAKAKQPKPWVMWRDVATTDVSTISAWWDRWPDAAIGLALGKSGLVVIDCDRKGEWDGVEAMRLLMADNGYSPDGVPIVATPGQGTHFFYRQPADKPLTNATGNLPKGIDVRGHGGYVIAPGTVMHGDRLYEVFGNIEDAPVIPDWLVHIIRMPRVQTSNADLSSFPDRPITDAELSDLLNAVSPDCDYQNWLICLQAVHHETGGSQAGLSLVDAWSSRSSKYPGGETMAKKWRSFRGSGVTKASLAEIARQHGADLSAIGRAHFEPPEVPAHVQAENDAVSANIMRAWLERQPPVPRVVLDRDGAAYDAETGEFIGLPPMPSTDNASFSIPPGLVGDIARWIMATARYPQPSLSVAAALTVVGMCAGRQIAGPTQAGTALFVLGLAKTASGKDHPLKQISRLLGACNLMHHHGPSEFISMTSVINTIKKKPLCLAPMDEFGDFMRRVYARRGSPHERAIPKVLRTLWSANFGPVSTPEWAGIESVTLNAPHLSLYGVSTHEQFYTALEGGAASDGTLNRFLIVNAPDRVAQVKPAMDGAKVPESIRVGLMHVYERAGQLATAHRNQIHVNPAEGDFLVTLPWSADGAEGAWTAYSVEIENRMNDDPVNEAFWPRAAEMAIRIATIIAAGCHADEVRLEHVQAGIAMADASVRTMIAGAADYMADTETGAQFKAVLRLLRERGGVVRYRDIFKSNRDIRARDLREILQTLVDTEEIERVEIKGHGRTTQGYRLLE